jgi:hypothetical protein
VLVRGLELGRLRTRKFENSYSRSADQHLCITHSEATGSGERPALARSLLVHHFKLCRCHLKPNFYHHEKHRYLRALVRNPEAPAKAAVVLFTVLLFAETGCRTVSLGERSQQPCELTLV